MPGVNITEVLGNYLILVDVHVFWAYVVAFTIAFAVGVPWLANRPQPSPEAMAAAWRSHGNATGGRR